MKKPAAPTREQRNDPAFAERLLIEATLRLMDIHRDDLVMMKQLADRLDGLMELKYQREQSELRLTQMRQRHELERRRDERKLLDIRQRNEQAARQARVTTLNRPAPKRVCFESTPDPLPPIVGNVLRYGIVFGTLKTLVE